MRLVSKLAGTLPGRRCLAACLPFALAFLPACDGGIPTPWGSTDEERTDWPQSFPAEAPADLLSAPHRLPEHHGHHATGWWFDEGPVALEYGELGCSRLDEEFQPAVHVSAPPWSAHEPTWFNDVVDLGQAEEQLVVLAGDTACCPWMGMGVSAEGKELWRFNGSGGMHVAVPLRDAGGLYGVAFGPNEDYGLDAIGLRGERLWQADPGSMLWQVSTHIDLPGKLLVVGGGVQILDHSRTGAEAPSRFARILAHLPSFDLFAHVYADSGALFPDEAGEAAAIVGGSGFSQGPVVVRLDHDGEEVWRAHTAASVEGIVLLGRRRGAHVFAAATRGREILLFDEHGTLLDGLHVGGEEQTPPYMVLSFRGGSIGEDRWALMLDSTDGDFAVEVDLDRD